MGTRIKSPLVPRLGISSRSERADARIDQVNLPVEGKFDLPIFECVEKAIEGGLKAGDMWQKGIRPFGEPKEGGTSPLYAILGVQYVVDADDIEYYSIDPRIAAMDQGIKGYQEALEENDSRIADKENELSGAKESKEAFEEKTQELQKEIQTAKDELAKQEEACAAEPSTECQEAIAELKAKIATMEADLAKSQSELATLTALVNQLRKELDELEEERTELEQRLKALEQAKNLLEERKAILELEQSFRLKTGVETFDDLARGYYECGYPTSGEIPKELVIKEPSEEAMS